MGNECGMSGGTATADFKRFDHPWVEDEERTVFSEPHIPEKGVRWYENIHPVLAVRSVIMTDLGGERENLPELRNDFLFLSYENDWGDLVSLDEMAMKSSSNHIYKAFVCAWSADRDRQELKDDIA